MRQTKEYELKIVQDKAAYDALGTNLPTQWQIGNCTVLDKDDNEITE